VTSVLTDTFEIHTTYVNDASMQQFCGIHPYLGVVIDVSNSVNEIDDGNNYAWKQVQIYCPDASGKLNCSGYKSTYLFLNIYI